MKERPILFNGPMVRAILEGRKTQTRRVVKATRAWPIEFIGGTGDQDDPSCYGFEDGNTALWWVLAKDEQSDTRQIPSPYGVAGDRLWVRETWQHSNHPLGPYEADCDMFYRADYLDDPLGPDLERSKDGIRRAWRPSIHMPRAAARITLEVTGVRVERLQDISSGRGSRRHRALSRPAALGTLHRRCDRRGISQHSARSVLRAVGELER